MRSPTWHVRVQVFPRGTPGMVQPQAPCARTALHSTGKGGGCSSGAAQVPRGTLGWRGSRD